MIRVNVIPVLGVPIVGKRKRPRASVKLRSTRTRGPCSISLPRSLKTRLPQRVGIQGVRNEIDIVRGGDGPRCGDGGREGHRTIEALPTNGVTG